MAAILPTFLGLAKSNARQFPVMTPRVGSASFDISGWGPVVGVGNVPVGWNCTPTPGGGDPSYYLSLGMDTGKWYWEAKLLSTNFMPGITQSTAHYIWASGPNDLGFYTSGGSSWGSLGSFASGMPMTIATNDVYGFAYDAGTRVLKIYRNNTLVATSNPIAGSTVIYPVFGWQGGSVQIRLRTGTTYSAPAGYDYY